MIGGKMLTGDMPSVSQMLADEKAVARGVFEREEARPGTSEADEDVRAEGGFSRHGETEKKPLRIGRRGQGDPGGKVSANAGCCYTGENTGIATIQIAEQAIATTQNTPGEVAVLEIEDVGDGEEGCFVGIV